MKMSPLLVKGSKILAYARHLRPLSREGSLLCHTCCDTGPRFFQSHPKESAIQSLLTTRKGMLRTYSNLGHHGAHIIQIKLLSRDILNKEMYTIVPCSFSFWHYGICKVKENIKPYSTTFLLQVDHFKSTECYDDEMRETIR
jgi:hypothetical protein